MPALVYRQLYRALSLIFISIAVIGGGGLFLLSDSVATHWLNAESLPLIRHHNGGSNYGNQCRLTLDVWAVSGRGNGFGKTGLAE